MIHFEIESHKSVEQLMIQNEKWHNVHNAVLQHNNDVSTVSSSFNDFCFLIFSFESSS